MRSDYKRPSSRLSTVITRLKMVIEASANTWVSTWVEEGGVNIYHTKRQIGGLIRSIGEIEGYAEMMETGQDRTFVLETLSHVKHWLQSVSDRLDNTTAHHRIDWNMIRVEFTPLADVMQQCAARIAHKRVTPNHFQLGRYQQPNSYLQ